MDFLLGVMSLEELEKLPQFFHSLLATRSGNSKDRVPLTNDSPANRLRDRTVIAESKLPRRSPGVVVEKKTSTLHII